MPIPTRLRHATLFSLAFFVAACGPPAPPIADDPLETDQVAGVNYALTYGKDAWTEHLVVPPVDDLIRREWVPSEAQPGCAVGLVEDGEITYLKGYGMASMGDAGSPPAKWAYYTAAPVGSIAKTITALALRSLDLEWGNNMSVNDTVGTHLPADPPIAGMSLKDLLSHSTGVKKNPTFEAGSLPDTCGPGEILTCDEMSWWLTHPRIAFEQYDDDVGALGAPKYSNIGYSVLGAVIDELTHDVFFLPFDTRGYEAYTWQRVGRYVANDTYEGQMLSLALTHSWRVEEHDIPNYAHGYDLNGNLTEAWAGLTEGWEGPAGGWVMTIGDLARLVAALMKDEIVGQTTLDEMLVQDSNVLGGYGQGIAMESDALYWHGGDIGGYAAVWAWWPDATPKPFGVALMCNRAGPGFQALDLLDVAKGIRALYGSGGGTAQSTLPPAGAASTGEVHGAVYSLDLSTARITRPAGFFVPLDGGAPLWVKTKALSDSVLDLTLLAGERPDDRSVKRTPLGTVPYDGRGSFRTATPLDLQFSSPMLGIVTARDVVLSAAFADGGKALADVRLTGVLDARDLAPMADEGWPKICRDLDPAEGACVPCDDGNPSCIQVTAEWIDGARFERDPTGRQ